MTSLPHLAFASAELSHLLILRFRIVEVEGSEGTYVNHEAKILFPGRQGIYELEMSLKSFPSKDQSHVGDRPRAL